MARTKQAAPVQNPGRGGARKEPNSGVKKGVSSRYNASRVDVYAFHKAKIYVNPKTPARTALNAWKAAQKAYDAANPNGPAYNIVNPPPSAIPRHAAPGSKY